MKDGVSNMVCERWYVTKLVCQRSWVTKLYVKDGVPKTVCDKVVCQTWWVTDVCVCV